MPANVTRVMKLILELPQQGKLAYCLFRDPRVPAGPKATLVGALAIIISPLDFPEWIPILGELDMLALGVLAVKIFVDACPEEVVREHRAATKAGTSVFDEDARVAAATLREAAQQLWRRLGRRVGMPAQRGRLEGALA